MNKKRRKKELTAMQLRKLATLISGIFLIVFIILGIIFVSSRSDLLDNIFYYFSIVIATIALHTCILIFVKEPLKKLKEEELETLNILSKTEFKAINFRMRILPQYKDPLNMLMEILNTEGCEFYAKIDNEKGIIIKCIDKHGEEVYSDKIMNVLYFRRIFEVL